MQFDVSAACSSDGLFVLEYLEWKSPPEIRLMVSNAIKLIENALKEARQGAFRVRNCRGFEKMCIPNRRRGTPPEKI